MNHTFVPKAWTKKRAPETWKECVQVIITSRISVQGQLEQAAPTNHLQTKCWVTPHPTSVAQHLRGGRRWKLKTHTTSEQQSRAEQDTAPPASVSTVRKRKRTYCLFFDMFLLWSFLLLLLVLVFGDIPGAVAPHRTPCHMHHEEIVFSSQSGKAPSHPARRYEGNVPPRSCDCGKTISLDLD